jgi:hypothetical protein
MGRKQPKEIPLQPVIVYGEGKWNASKVLVVISIVLFVLTRSYILFVLRPQMPDTQIYFFYAVQEVDLHQTPYQKEFQVEYPPLSLWTMYVPRILDEGTITNLQDPQQLTPAWIDYERGFRGMMFLCDLTSFVILFLIVRNRSPQLVGWAAIFYTITTAILGHLLYDRLDVGLLMLLVLGVYSWTRSFKESRCSIAWSGAAYILVGLGISFKIIPVLSVPFLLWSDFHSPRRTIRLLTVLPALLIGAGLPFLIQYTTSGWGVFDLFKHHAEREIQIESLYSSLMIIASAFGWQTFVSYSDGAYNLSGNLSNFMKLLSEILLLGFLAAMGVWALLRWSRYSRRDAYCFSCYVIPATVILSNVLSPQYFIWAFPLLLLFTAEIVDGGKILPWIIGVLLVSVALMTTWICPYNYACTDLNQRGLIPMTLAYPMPPYLTAHVVVGVRNFVYLVAIIWLGVMLIMRIDRNRSQCNGHT